jgi:hypothetical protein
MLKARLTLMLLCAIIVGIAFGVGSLAFAGLIEAGDDFFSSTGEITLTLSDNLGGLMPGFVGFSEIISVDSGGILAKVHRDQQQGGFGFPGDGSYIDTEIISLDLFGNIANLGNAPMHVRVGTDNGVLTPSIGMIENVETEGPYNNTIMAADQFVSGDSWFDVFFEIDAMGMTFYNKDPKRMGPEYIEKLPPWVVYESPVPIDLWMKNPSGDVIVGEIGVIKHDTTPEPSTLLLLSVGLVGLLGFGRKRLSRLVIFGPTRK